MGTTLVMYTSAIKTIGICLIVLAGNLLFQPILADEDKINVFRHTSLVGWNVNSYWIETEEGIVLIDGQLLIMDAKNLGTLIKSRSKKVTGLIITHPHPDHFGGINTLQNLLGKFPVYATQKTTDAMKSAHETYLKSVAPQFGAQAHKTLIMPNHILESGKNLQIAGIELYIDDLGPGEAPDNIVVWHKASKTLFTGDATMHGSHYYTGEGRSEKILKSFDHLKNHYKHATRLLTGHGDPADISIIDSHIDYVATIRHLVSEAIKDKVNLNKDETLLSKEARAVIAGKIVDKFPSFSTFGMPQLQIATWNIYGVEQELLKK